jgi:hypothetical protein
LGLLFSACVLLVYRQTAAVKPKTNDAKCF